MGLGRGKGNGEISVQSIGRMGKTEVTEVAVTTDARSIFQYFTSLTENADPCMTISLRKLLPLLLV